MPRQNWRASTPPRATPTAHTIPASCTPLTLYPGYEISLGPASTLTLTATAVATPACFTAAPTALPLADQDPSAESLSPADLRDPFYASTIPMAYSISATTTLAYVLLFLLFLPNPPNSRPWLQKLATLTVVVCLTIAFAETTTVLEQEYRRVGSSLYSLTNEARDVRRRVVSGTVIRVGRIVSDLFLWLAQVQTLIRLFPREREKVIIKWAGFCLILLDTIFSILQSFVSPLTTDPESFLDAIPALSYLFQIALSLLYASCVIYYSLAKRKYSYFYPYSFFKHSTPGSKQYGGRSIVLVAVLSIASVLTPIVFFILDIAQKDLIGWGDYIRWVGAASASAVVWEWVDRIEGLEREESKGGVLGREVFDEEEEEDGFQDSRGRRPDNHHHHHHHHHGAAGGGAPAPAPQGNELSRATTLNSLSTVYARRATTPADDEIHRFPTNSTRSRARSSQWDEESTAHSHSHSHTPPPPPTLQQMQQTDTASFWPWRRRDAAAGGREQLGRVQLPVTVIPAPKRAVRGSWGAGAGAGEGKAEGKGKGAEGKGVLVDRVDLAAGVELPPSRSTVRTSRTGSALGGGGV